MDDDATLPEETSTAQRPSGAVDKRYRLGEVLGAGGMGEVRLAKDVTIDRDVAIKLLRNATSDKETIARFFREARVQGKLDHPAVVPVHDIGIDAAGHPYFVMK
jgi:eukaryotic-like serine/threonine-protein kinase